MTKSFVDSDAHVPGRGRIYDSITQTIGDTPLVRLDRIAKAKGVKANLLGKLEFFNPTSSVKDRIGVGMIDAMEARRARSRPASTTLVEPTSGNTGIGLAFVAAARGYKLTLVMPESMSIERRKMLLLLGAETRADAGRSGHEGRDRQGPRADRRRRPVRSCRSSSRTPPTRRSTRAPPPRRSGTTRGEVDAFVAGVGTGGTITGVGETLKPRRPSMKIIAVEPEDSPVLSGGKPGLHKIQGIGAGFVPPVLDTKIIDEVIKVSNQASFDSPACSRGSRAFPAASRPARPWRRRSRSASGRRSRARTSS